MTVCSTPSACRPSQHAAQHRTKPADSNSFASICITFTCCSMRAGTSASPLAAASPSPTATAVAGCTCNTTSNTLPQPTPTITFTSTDSCVPASTTASNSTTGAIYFTAQVQFNGPVQAGGLTPASFGVGSVAAANLTSNSTDANCSCGATIRREATPGVLNSVQKRNERKDYAFRRQFNEKPSITQGCPS